MRSRGWDDAGGCRAVAITHGSCAETPPIRPGLGRPNPRQVSGCSIRRAARRSGRPNMIARTLCATTARPSTEPGAGPRAVALESPSSLLPLEGGESGRETERGRTAAEPLADRARPPAENCPSDHGPLYAPCAGQHRSRRQRKGRDMNRRSSRRPSDRGVRVRAGFGKPRVFNGLRRLAADRGAIFGVFSARSCPFLSGMVRHSQGWSVMVRGRRLPSALPSPGRGKSQGAGGPRMAGMRINGRMVGDAEC